MQLVRSLILASACGILMASAAMAGVVTFDQEPLGTQYGTPAGDSPGDLVFTEDNVDVYVQTFFSSGTPTFGFGEINPFFPSRNFFDANNLRFNNIGFEFDFGGVGTEVSFQYMNLGGGVNLSINGGTPVEANSFAALPGTIGGATVSVTQTSVQGGVKGRVLLTGPISRVRIGGQELFIDDVTGDGSDEPDGPSLDDVRCDLSITHEFLVDGTVYGNSAGMPPGDLMFSESGIPVSTQELTTGGGGTAYGDAKVVTPGFIGFGAGQALQYSGMNGFYGISALGINVKKVEFEYFDFGGVENVEVNGEGLYVGNISNLPANIATGVTASVTSIPDGGGVRGVVTLVGNVQKLTLGGQELFVDEFCIEQGLTNPGTCQTFIDFESQNLGESWGASEGNNPGDLIFVENDIEVYVLPYFDGSSDLFGLAGIETPICDQTTSQAMNLKDISVGFALNDVQPVSYGRFDFCDCAGHVNLFINGVVYVGPIWDIPFDFFSAVGIECDVNLTEVSPDCVGGYVEMSGPLSALYVGGPQFQVDNFCVDGEATSDAPELSLETGISMTSQPNPFRAQTSLRFSLPESGPVELSVFDLGGRRIATLVDETMPAGAHQIGWNGTSDLGERVSTGIYLVRLQQNGRIFTQKLAVSR